MAVIKSGRKGECGGKPRVGKVGDAKGRGLGSRRSVSRSRRRSR